MRRHALIQTQLTWVAVAIPEIAKRAVNAKMAATDLCRNKLAQLSTWFVSLAGRHAHQTAIRLTMFAKSPADSETWPGDVQLTR